MEPSPHLTDSSSFLPHPTEYLAHHLRLRRDDLEAGHPADEEPFVEDLVDFGISYADRARKDHALFVAAFREGKFDLVSAVG